MMTTMGTASWTEMKTMTEMGSQMTWTWMTTAMVFLTMTTSWRKSFEHQETQCKLFEWDFKYKCPRVMFQRPVSCNGSDRSVDLHISSHPHPHKRCSSNTIGGQRRKPGDGWDDQTGENFRLGLGGSKWSNPTDVVCLCLVQAHCTALILIIPTWCQDSTVHKCVASTPLAIRFLLTHNHLLNTNKNLPLSA